MSHTWCYKNTCIVNIYIFSVCGHRLKGKCLCMCDMCVTNYIANVMYSLTRKDACSILCLNTSLLISLLMSVLLLCVFTSNSYS